MGQEQLQPPEKVIEAMAECLLKKHNRVTREEVIAAWRIAVASVPSETAQKPVAYVVQSDSDGSIGSTIAPCNYAMFADRLEELKDEPWVKNGIAKIVPLYLAPVSAPSAIVEKSEEVQQLRAFAKRIFDMVDWPECFGEVDGASFQTAALDAGLLRAEIRHEPCGDGEEKPCQCIEWHGGAAQSIWQSGVTCYRKAPYLVEKP